MVRLLTEEIREELRRSAGRKARSRHITIATGRLVGPILDGLVREITEVFPQVRADVVPITNHFFGELITVSGLITGQDLIAQLKGKDLGERLLISQNMIRRDEQDFLDDITLEEASAALGVPIYPNRQDGFDLCDAMFGLLPELDPPKREEKKNEYYEYNPHSKEG